MTLTIRDLQVAYDDVPAVRGVSLTVPDGQVLAVLGPSGCGKSTLLRGVAGLEQASGEVAWDGEDVSRLPTHRRGFALMFQDGQLFDHLTVARNVGYALRLRRRGGAGRGGRAGERRRVEELLALVGLEGYADRLPRTLSGGERQRVALARSLAHSLAWIVGGGIQNLWRGGSLESGPQPATSLAWIMDPWTQNR